MNTRTMVNLGMAVILAGAVISVGCGGKVAEEVTEKVAEKAVEKALSTDGQKVDVNIDSKEQSMTMKVQGKEGENESMDMTVSGDGDNVSMTTKTADGVMHIATGTNAKLPENFPKDIPLCPSLTLDIVQTLDVDAFTIQATSLDLPEKLAEYFRAELAKQGWTEQMGMSQPGENAVQILNYQKDDRAITLMIMKEETDTKISLSTGKQ